MWNDSELAKITDAGLLVKFPGFAVMPKKLDDLPVRNPWKSLPRTPEIRIVFKVEDGAGWSIASKQDALNSKEEFALHSLVDGGSCHVILAAKRPRPRDSIGVLGRVTSSSDNGSILNFNTVEHIMVIRVSDSENIVLDRVESVAYKLRNEPSTVQLATMESSNDTANTAYLEEVERLKVRLDEVCTEELKNPSLRDAIAAAFPSVDPMGVLRTLRRE